MCTPCTGMEREGQRQREGWKLVPTPALSASRTLLLATEPQTPGTPEDHQKVPLRSPRSTVPQSTSVYTTKPNVAWVDKIWVHRHLAYFWVFIKSSKPQRGFPFPLKHKISPPACGCISELREGTVLEATPTSVANAIMPLFSSLLFPWTKRGTHVWGNMFHHIITPLQAILFIYSTLAKWDPPFITIKFLSKNTSGPQAGKSMGPYNWGPFWGEPVQDESSLWPSWNP